MRAYGQLVVALVPESKVKLESYMNTAPLIKNKNREGSSVIQFRLLTK